MVTMSLVFNIVYMLPVIQNSTEGQMTRTVTTTEAKAKLSELLGWVREHRDRVIVENRGEPSAVILSYHEFEELQQLREQQRRQEAIATLRRLRDEVRARNGDLTDEQAEALAERAARDTIDGLIERGQVRFQQS